jgi:hypothetical protein
MMNDIQEVSIIEAKLLIDEACGEVIMDESITPDERTAALACLYDASVYLLWQVPNYMRDIWR